MRAVVETMVIIRVLVVVLGHCKMAVVSASASATATFRLATLRGKLWK